MSDEKPAASWLPLPHFMALAPLDAWARLLFRHPRFHGPRYLARLVLGLFTSYFGTCLTLPERLLLAPYLLWRFRGPRPTLHRPVVVIAGYFRSGTTHLHYLLSCDPQMRTPRWVQVCAPQGFFGSWALVRWMMIPFVSNSRPQDDVAFGPEWPSEDDFALNNWVLASSLPGRFIYHSQHPHYDRWHFLEGLSARELARWRRAQAAFCWKFMAFARRKTLLLKSPSHTARVRELSELFGPQLRIIHITREPDSVVKSNVRMAERLEPYALEPLPPLDQIRLRVTDEFVRTEEKFLAEAAALPPGSVAHVRFEDLVNDPLGHLRRCYDELGLTWTDDAERGFRRYLGAVRDYKPRHNPPPTSKQLEPRLQQLASRFGHDAPPVEPVHIDHGVQLSREPRAIALTWLLVPLLAAGWVGLTALIRDRFDPLIWAFGIVLGYVAVRTAGRGSLRLGLMASAAFLCTLAIAIYPATFFGSAHKYSGDLAQKLATTWVTVGRHATVANHLFYTACGLVSAFRIATRKHVRPPGA
ncbi:MAG: sulfotransferase [Leptolyngbya sp. PLA3]|nr:MAG: sulfotransferase [Cyanobacteria bacterium CYA]MCE7967128.1 sulfotransferase [Leptolyngbya sp. PL-A3]